MKKHMLWLLTYIFFSSYANAQQPTVSRGLAYKIVVKINGNIISGAQEASASQASPKSVTVLQAPMNKMRVYSIEGNGIRVDITNSPALTVKDSSRSLKFANGMLTAPFSAKTGPSRLTLMLVVYAPLGKNGPYGLNEYNIRVPDNDIVSQSNRITNPDSSDNSQ